MVGDWWIDDVGKWRAAELPGTDAEAASPIGNSLFEHHTAYRQLGLVKATISAPTVVFRWDLWHAAPEAIDSVTEFLDISKQSRNIVLKFFYGGWVTETFDDAAEAIERIERISLYRSVEMIDTVFVREQDLDAVKTGSEVIRYGFEYFDRARHLFDIRDEKAFKSLYSRALVYAAADDGSAFLRLHVGENAAFAMVTDARQTQVAKQAFSVAFKPVNRYSRQISAAYAEVLNEREPRLHHVRALFKKDGREPIWVPYQRLLFPSELSDGTPVFVCLSDITPDISIPFLQPNRSIAFGGSD